MKPDIRWQLLLAAVCIGLVAAVVGVEFQSEALCTEILPASGGRLQEGLVGLPSHINPLLSDSNPVDEYLVDLIFDGLTRYDESGLLVPALAQSWTISDSGTEIIFQIGEDVTWHDGEQVTSEDILFTYGLLKNEDFPASESLKSIWDSVSIEAIDEKQVRFEIIEPYGPFLDATTTGLLPAHVLDSTSPGDLIDHPFNQRPIGTGPFIVFPERDWRQDGILSLAPNPHYWRQGTSLDGIDLHFYPNSEQLAQAYRSEEVQALVSIQAENMDQLSGLPDIRIFNSRSPQMFQIIFNIGGSEAQVVQGLEFRQALAYGLNRGEIINEALKGFGMPLEGPYLPSSWAYNSGKLREYEYDPDLAGTLLSTGGWEWAAGDEFRTKDGQPLEISLLHPESSKMRSIVENIREQWADLGIKVRLVSVPVDDFTTSLSEGEFALALVEIEPAEDPDLYDFWSQEAIVRGQNYGGWNNRLASEALEAARQLIDPLERKAYYDVFLEYYDNDLPAFTLFQSINSYGVNSAVEEVEIGHFDTPRELYESYANWFLTYEEVVVACSEEGA